MVEQRSPKPRAEGSSPSAPAILVILNSCTPLKARSYGLFWRFRGEKFKVKTVAVFCSVLQEKGIRTDAEECLGKIKGRFEKNNLKSAFFDI